MATLDNPVFKDFVFYSVASVGKMFACTFYTIYARITRKVFVNPEDGKASKRKDFQPKVDEVVERIRRNHLNDIENILPFTAVGAFYVLTNPDRTTALWHFRAFFYSRLLHFFAYQLPLPQPARFLTFGVGMTATLSMMYQCTRKIGFDIEPFEFIFAPENKMAVTLTLDNPVFRDFIFYSTATIAKMFLCPLTTVYYRRVRGVHANPEDAKLLGSTKVTLDDEKVERTRRNHLNDLENILPFVSVGTFYVLTNPDHNVALWHFRLFFFSRVLHFIAYQVPLRQPSRAIACSVGFFATLSMIYRILKETY